MTDRCDPEAESGPGGRVRLVSTSRASDGSFTAISEIGALLRDEQHRLIGGVAIVLHQHRLGLQHPVRSTADADFGIPPYALKDDSLIEAVASIGYRQIGGNRWTRAIDDTREATVDLLVPSYQTRVRSSVQHGSTNTTEVGGLAEALKRPAIAIAGEVTLTDGVSLTFDVVVPDATSMLGLKLHARRVRDEDRDARDLWACMELIGSSSQVDAVEADAVACDHLQLGGLAECFPVDDLDAGQPSSTAWDQLAEFVTGRHSSGGREDELVPRRLQPLELGVNRSGGERSRCDEDAAHRRGAPPARSES